MGEDSIQLVCDDDEFSSRVFSYRTLPEHCENIPDSLLSMDDATLGEQCPLLSPSVVVVHLPLPTGLLFDCWNCC